MWTRGTVTVVGTISLAGALILVALLSARHLMVHRKQQTIDEKSFKSTAWW